jgi:catechol 2,3-dioxygenase-like lactoylglutathione lyase family enzyme
MPTSVNHHVGLRVADLERSIGFYQEAFGARLQTQPMQYGPPDAGEILDGPDDLTFRVCHVGFDDGTIELFELGDPHRDTEPIPATRGGIIHYAIQVDDVEGALARVEQAGGRRLWKELREITPDAKVVYVTDPDGHVLELISLPIDELVDVINATVGSGGSPPGLAT